MMPLLDQEDVESNMSAASLGRSNIGACLIAFSDNRYHIDVGSALYDLVDPVIAPNQTLTIKLDDHTWHFVN